MKKQTKKQKGAVVMLTIFAASMILMGCGGGGSSAVVGRWTELAGETVEFFKDGTVNLEGSRGNYVSENNRLRITFQASDEIFVWDYKLADNILSVTDSAGSTYRYARIGGSSGSSLNGIWKGIEGDSVEFFKDGNANIDGTRGNWVAEKNRLRITFSNSDQIFVWDYSIEGRIMTITSGGVTERYLKE